MSPWEGTARLRHAATAGWQGGCRSPSPPDDVRTAAVTEAVDVPVRRLDPDLPLPAYAHPGDAGADLVAAEDVELAPGARALVRTGRRDRAARTGYVGLVHPRSGLAARLGVTVLNAPGTVDAGYRGEILVNLVNHDPAGTVEDLPGRPHRPARRPAGRAGRVPRRRRARRHRSRCRRARLDRRAPRRCHRQHKLQNAVLNGRWQAMFSRKRGGPQARARGRRTAVGRRWPRASPATSRHARARPVRQPARARRGAAARPGQPADPGDRRRRGAGAGQPGRRRSSRSCWSHGDSALQLGVFAAPRSEGIWDEVRDEIAEAMAADGVAAAGGPTAPYGIELARPGQHARRARPTSGSSAWTARAGWSGRCSRAWPPPTRASEGALGECLPAWSWSATTRPARSASRCRCGCRKEMAEQASSTQRRAADAAETGRRASPAPTGART